MLFSQRDNTPAVLKFRTLWKQIHKCCLDHQPKTFWIGTFLHFLLLSNRKWLSSESWKSPYCWKLLYCFRLRTHKENKKGIHRTGPLKNSPACAGKCRTSHPGGRVFSCLYRQQFSQGLGLQIIPFWSKQVCVTADVRPWSPQTDTEVSLPARWREPLQSFLTWVFAGSPSHCPQTAPWAILRDDSSGKEDLHSLRFLWTPRCLKPAE